MNFGKKIVVLYVSFVALIVTLVSMSFSQKVDLVSDDYYAQEIKFQDKIDAINNEKNLEGTILHLLSINEIKLMADSSVLSSDFKGSIRFFRPSDSSKDIQLEMNFVNNVQTISTKHLIHGAYKLQLTWTNQKKNYFKEEVIFIN